MNERAIVLKCLLFYTITFSTLLISSCGNQATASANDSLIVEINFDKTTFFYGERIFSDMYLINNTSDILNILPLRGSLMFAEYEIISSSGEERERTAVSSGHQQETIQLMPFDTFWVEHNLSFFYGTTLLEGNRVTTLPIDTYNVQGIYQKEYLSNQIKISILEPDSSEKEAFELLYEINRGSEEQMIVAAEQLLERYLQSVYAPEALYQLSWAYAEKDWSKVFAIAERFIEEYPNSFLYLTPVRWLFNSKSYEDKVAFLETIASEKANTRIGRWARTWLKDLLERGPGDE